MIDHDRATIEAMERSGSEYYIDFAARYTQASDDTRATMRDSNIWREYAAKAHNPKEEAQ